MGSFEHIQEVSEKIIQTLNQNIIGQDHLIRSLWTCVLSGGHVLLEGVPGIGKTFAVRSLAKLIDGDCRRVQFTPDLMPSDITGTKVYDMQTGHFTFRQGPVFTHILIADEINRTPPKTQSALLEAMEEKQVSLDGETYLLPKLFFVVATQNPIEHEGTYPLPEAQLDRFAVKIQMDYPDPVHESKLLMEHYQIKQNELKPIVHWEEILEMRKTLEEVGIEPVVIEYLLKIVQATRKHPKVVLGASPRAGLTTLSLSKAEAAINGRSFVTPDDVKKWVKPTLAHRLVLEPDGEWEGWNAYDILDEILDEIPVPR